MEGIRFWHFTYGPTLADRSEIVSDMRIVTQSFMFLGSTGISCRSVRCHYFKILPFSHCLHQSAQPEAELPKSHLHSEDKADGGAHSASDSTPIRHGSPSSRLSDSMPLSRIPRYRPLSIFQIVFWDHGKPLPDANTRCTFH